MKRFARHPSVSSLALDLLLVALAWMLAFWIRFNLEVPREFLRLAVQTLPVPLLAYLVALTAIGVHRHVWRYISLSELRQLARAVIVAGVLAALIVLMLRVANFPRSVLLLHPLLCLLALLGVRAGWRSVFERALPGDGASSVLVLGTVAESAEALQALKGSTRWRPVAILSPEAAERGLTLQRVPVAGTFEDIERVARSTGASAALVASQAGSAARRELLLRYTQGGVTLLTLPRADDWLHSGASAPRKIELEDLLGRSPVELDVAGLAEMLSGQTVLVTGAGGSIGSELCRQIAKFGATRLVCVDVSEFNIYQLEQALRASHPQLRGIYYTANVRDGERLLAIAQRHKPSVVFHAAAYKHVPLMEQLNEIEALRTNIVGTINTARVAGECGAARFVMVSTDKAVNPTNVMGASKRLAELTVQAQAAVFPQTQYVSVRFGNVLGSSGSVVPLFTSQIEQGGPVTVTHPDIVRYFMTIPEAAQLVLQAALMGSTGQIFVLDMGEPVRIVELARMLIRLSGKTEQEIPITFTGLRPGEKLFEELLADDESTLPTPHPKLRVSRGSGQLHMDLRAIERWVAEAGPVPSEAVLREWLRAYVPEYRPRQG